MTCALAAVCSLGAAGARAQQQQQTAPVLISEADTTRAVAVEPVTLLRDPFAVTSPSLVGADRRTRVALFAMNVRLYAGEGSTAFSAEAEDAHGRTHALAVEHVAPVPGFEGLTQITVRLAESLADAGDVLVRVSLRGMTSNRVRLAVGHAGGGPPDDVGSVPTPAPPTPPPAPPPLTPDPYTGPATSADTVRLLEQATWGPTPAEVARVRAMGLRAFLEEQFALAPSSYEQPPLVHVDSNQQCQGAARDACVRDNYTAYPLQTRFFKNALYRPDQLRQRVSFALHQILVVSGREMTQPSWLAPYLRALDRNAFGNFRTLLQEVTLTPAMGDFLNTNGNTKDRPNENFARELLQLFTVGPDLLDPEGTPRLDPQGRRIPAYTQEDITSFARVFTGWRYAPAPADTQGVFNFIDPMLPSERLHDAGAKTLLNGVTLPPGQTPLQDLNAALDNLFNHPNTAPFVARRLIRHLVTSNPSPAYVGRAARAFENNCAGFHADAACTGERGDMKALVRAILLDPEARGDRKTDPAYGRLREPAQFVNGFLRPLDPKGFGPGILNFVESDGHLNPQTQKTGQDIFRPQTVFGYFPAEYAVPGTGLTGPEFGVLQSSTALRRVGFVAQMIYHGGVQRGLDPNTPNGTFISLGAFQPLASDPARLVSALDEFYLHGTMSPAMRAAVIEAVQAIPASDPNHPRNRTWTALYLVTSSPQYQVQR